MTLEKLTAEQVVKAIRTRNGIADVLTNEKLTEFAEYAVKGQAVPLRLALYNMVQGYIDNCGISAATRTIYYDAGQELLKVYAKREGDSIAKMVREHGWEFGAVMEHLNHNFYGPDFDEYETEPIKTEDYLILASSECSYNIPEDMKAALCYGIYLKLSCVMGRKGT